MTVVYSAEQGFLYTDRAELFAYLGVLGELANWALLEEVQLALFVTEVGLTLLLGKVRAAFVVANVSDVLSSSSSSSFSLSFSSFKTSTKNDLEIREGFHK